jgi:transposase
VHRREHHDRRIRLRRAARYDDPGDDFYLTTINTDRKARTHIRQLEALGFTVTVTPAA